MLSRPSENYAIFCKSRTLKIFKCETLNVAKTMKLASEDLLFLHICIF